MTAIFLPSLCLALFTLSLFGWGKAGLRITGATQQAYPASYVVAFGMAMIVLFGGVLNAADLAYGYVLLALLTFGLIISFYILAAAVLDKERGDAAWHKFSRLADSPPPELLSYVLLAGLATYLVVFLLPSDNYNFHDDYHSYFPRISSMLATGSLGNNPLALIGVDSLGAQQFLQAFVTSLFGFKYINAFDAVFCMILCCALIIRLARLAAAHWTLGLAGVIAAALINAQQVNVSSVFSSSAMCVALVYGALAAEGQSYESIRQRILQLVPVLLFCSALIALKLMSAVFAAMFFLLFMFVSAPGESSRSVFRWRVFVAGGFSVTAITAPWFLVHWVNYKTAVKLLLDNQRSAFSGSVDVSSNLSSLSLKQFFSAQELFWGGSYLGYNILFLLLTAAFVWLAAAAIVRRLSAHERVALSVTGATALSYSFALLVFEPDMALRYCVPFLIAAIAVTPILLFTSVTSVSSSGEKAEATGNRNLAAVLSIVVLQMVLIYSFSDSFVRRLKVMQETRSTLMFPLTENYKNYTQATFSPQRETAHKKIQELCRPETGVFTWVSTAFLFDHRRHTIVNFADPATMTPWFNLPTSGDTESLRRALLDIGIECIIWEFAGYGMKTGQQHLEAASSPIYIQRRLGEAVLALRSSLESLANASTLKYNRDGLVVMDIAEQQSP